MRGLRDFGLSGMMAGAAMFLLSGSATAQDHANQQANHLADHKVAPVCHAGAQVPAELAGWSAKPVLVKAAKGHGKGSSASLKISERAKVALLPTPGVSFPVRPEKPGGSVSKSGIVTFDAPQAGVYRVALGAGAWIDVIEEGKALPSIAHGHGPDCSGIRKMVDYTVQAGPHSLQIAGNADAAIDVMVVRLR